MNIIDKRTSYEEEAREEHEATIQARQSVSLEYKKWTTDLWMKVINRAIEDIILAKTLEKSYESISEELIEYKKTASSFLFNPNHKIPFDDYLVEIQCPKCKNKWITKMSLASEKISICEICKYKISTKYIEYRITKKIVDKEISLEELLSLWGIENIIKFRKGCNTRINSVVKENLKKRIKNDTN